MKKMIWCSDIHLDHCYDKKYLNDFFEGINYKKPDYLVISGDISQDNSCEMIYHDMSQRIDCEILFVLGNHDYYHGSFSETNKKIFEICENNKNLIWLDKKSIIELTNNTCIVGHIGWADGRSGDYDKSDIELNDYYLISEFKGLNKTRRLELMQAKSDESVEYIKKYLPVALEKYNHVYLVTHAPPYKEACYYQGNMSNDDWLPHFTNFALGQVINEIYKEFEEKKLTVLCGHSHGEASYKPNNTNNFVVYAPEIEYGAPKIASVFEI